MRSSLVLITLPAALLIAAPGVARASSAYPGGIQAHLSLGYAPPCTVCHETDSGGSGTATKAFGSALRQNGLSGGGNTASLDSALDALAAADTDSDCDGVSDVTQLGEGREPNTGEYIDGSGKPAPDNAGCAETGSGEPGYGCGARVAAGSSNESAWPIAAALATMIGLALSRRRAARSEK